MAHTPGPWRLHDMEHATIVAGSPGGEVANCLNGFGDQDANTHLIIAAPEMADEIERLQLLLKEASEHIRHGSVSSSSLQRILTKIDAALETT